MNRIHFALLAMVFASLLLSCSNDEEPMQPQPATLHRVTLHIDGQLSNYETTRSSYTWKDSAKLYLQLYNGVNRIEGRAIYSADEDTWTMEFYGNVLYNLKSHCEVYYFENAVSETPTKVTFSPNTAVYCDTLASYFAQGNDLYLMTDLMPLTGRLCVAGTEGRSFSVYGLNYRTSYKIDDNKFTLSPPIIEHQTIAADGHSPYIYAAFANPDERQIVVSTDDDYEFRRPVDDSFLRHGRSGVMNLPTVEVHNGWKMYAPREEFQVGGVSFTMIKVSPGTFTMYYPINKSYRETTIEKSFLLGETEVTQELWETVMGSNPSKNQSGKYQQRPVERVSWDECNTFLDRLTKLTGTTFRMPIHEEWAFAATGGTKSQGYTYSGSNNLDEVAWYKGNSKEQTHDVKTKKPNELGFYDMNGNVEETGKYEMSLLKATFGGSYMMENCTPFTNSSLTFAMLTRSSDTGLRLAASIE